MSQQDVELVRKGFDAFARQDRAGIKALLDPEVTWYPALGPLLERSSYHGPDQICRLVLDEIPSVLQGFHAELLGIEDLGETALAIVKFHGTARSTGLPVAQTFFQLFRARNGKGIEMRAFTDRDAALQAARIRD